MAAEENHNAANPLILPQNHPISIKLTDTNFLIWKQQIIATVRGYGLEPFLYGDQEIPPKTILTPNSDPPVYQQNPLYQTWYRQDQLLSAWIQSSLSETIMRLVVGLTTTKEIWSTLETSFASQSRAKLMQYKLQLQTLKKESLTMREYLAKIKTCCDLLDSAGYHISDDDQVLHILAGLGTEYDSVMVTITSRNDTWSVQDVSALLLSFESRLESSKPSAVNSDGSQPSANVAQSALPRNNNNNNSQSNRGGYGRGGRTGYGFGSRGGRGGRGRSGGFNGGYTNNNNRAMCQICKKMGHTADRCYFRFEHNVQAQQQPQQQQQNGFQQHNNNNFQHPALNVAQAPPNFQPAPVDFNYESSTWYPDSGASHHVSNDYNSLNSASEYNGGPGNSSHSAAGHS